MSDVYKIASTIILNILISSIPENLFAVIFCIVFIGRFESLSFKARSIAKLMSIVLICSFISTTLRTLVPAIINYMPLIGTIIVILSICFVYKITGKRNIFKVSICSLLGIIIVGLIQTLYLPMVLLISSKTAEFLKTPSFYVFIWTLPERAIEVGLLVFILAKKTFILKINFLKTILESKLLTTLTTSVFLFNMIFLTLMVSLISEHKITYSLTSANQVLAIVVILVLPIINLYTIFTAIYYIKSKEILKRFSIQEELRVSISDISFFLKRGEYDRIKKELEYLERDTEELYKEHSYGR